MRRLDVYCYNNSGNLILAARNCVQLAPASSERESNAATYTMADGSLCVYPVEKDRLTVSVVLECSDSQATAILTKAPGSRFVFAGLDYGFNRSRPLGIQYRFGVLGYLTDKIKIQEISVKNNCYQLTIPVQLELNSYGEVSKIDLPSYIGLSTLQVGEIRELIEEPDYRLRSLDGAIIRNETFPADTAPVSFQAVALVKYDPGYNYSYVMQLFDANGNSLLRTEEECREEAKTSGVSITLNGWIRDFPDVVSGFCLRTFISVNGNETLHQEVWFSIRHEPMILSASDGSLFQTADGAFLAV